MKKKKKRKKLRTVNFYKKNSEQESNDKNVLDIYNGI